MHNPHPAFEPYPGADAEKRPRFEAVLARAFSFFMLYLFATVTLLEPRSTLGGVLASITKTGLLLAGIFNFMRWITHRRLRYRLGEVALTIPLDIRTIRIPYPTIARIERQDTRWTIKKGSLLTYAKEVPQLIEYVAQIGPFTVQGRGTVYFYSTLSSYHDPKGLILITTTNGKTYGISPAEPERFLEELEERRRQVRPH
ncbi:MAG TPA: PH domain-containing protein [Candidatus Methylomirabilis sp.]|nr:PH domain-containing protein [Candidatus Methylomirabilis sp.]